MTTATVQDIKLIDDGSVLVVDDFLAQEDRAALWAHFGTAPFVKVHNGGFVKAFRLHDGECLVSREHSVLRREHTSSDDPTGPAEDSSVVRLPRGDSLNPLSHALLTEDSVAKFLEVSGDWDTLTLQLYIYPPGSGLGWHFDANKAAAFIYYAHPHWHSSWGGELLVAPRTLNECSRSRDHTRPSDNDRSFHDFYRQLDGDAPALHPLGTFIAPVPNRLVLIRSGVPHSIKKVEAAAGAAFRASISGFFTCDESKNIADSTLRDDGA